MYPGKNLEVYQMAIFVLYYLGALLGIILMDLLQTMWSLEGAFITHIFEKN